MQRFNKASAAAIATGATGIIASMFPELSEEVVISIQTLLVTVLVWAVPNRA